jgi:hypothetical protein
MIRVSVSVRLTVKDNNLNGCSLKKVNPKKTIL